MKFFVSSMIGAAALVASLGAASAQDAAAGETVFKKCKVCHQIGEGARNMVGPVLNGVVGPPAGVYPNYYTIPTPTRIPASSGTRPPSRST